MSSLTFCHPVILQFLIAFTSFVADCKELSETCTKCIEPTLICCFPLALAFLEIAVYGHIYGLTRMLMSKNVNNDATMNPPIEPGKKLTRQKATYEKSVNANSYCINYACSIVRVLRLRTISKEKWNRNED